MRDGGPVRHPQHALVDTAMFDLAGEGGAHYEISVALPPSYAQGDRRYPLLVALDGNICFGIAADSARAQAYTGEAREILVVGVSIPRSEGVAGYGFRRLVDFCPVAPRVGKVPQPIRGLIERRFAAAGLSVEQDMAGGARFRSFLTGTLLPYLQSHYRVEAGEVGLFGHSASGIFSAWCLLDRCPGFGKYIIGSYATGFDADLDAALAAERKFLATQPKVAVVTGIGGDELKDPALGALFRTGLEQMQRLAAAKAPGLEVQVRVFEHEGHASVMAALIAAGIRHHWRGLVYSDAMKART